MATKRKTISKKTRFEVFKRDSFKCQYCGASAPEAILVVDHIDPFSKGGAEAKNARNWTEFRNWLYDVMGDANV